MLPVGLPVRLAWRVVGAALRLEQGQVVGETVGLLLLLPPHLLLLPVRLGVDEPEGQWDTLPHAVTVRLTVPDTLPVLLEVRLPDRVAQALGLRVRLGLLEPHTVVVLLAE